MKTAREIILNKFPAKEYSEADFDRIEESMKEYARQAIDEVASKAEADVEFMEDLKLFFKECDKNDMGQPVEGEDYEVAVNRQSILNVKDELT